MKATITFSNENQSYAYKTDLTERLKEGSLNKEDIRFRVVRVQDVMNNKSDILYGELELMIQSDIVGQLIEEIIEDEHSVITIFPKGSVKLQVDDEEISDES